MPFVKAAKTSQLPPETAIEVLIGGAVIALCNSNGRITALDGSCPHRGGPLRYAEQGSLKMLWISGTNPAVSLPDLHRVRSILSQERLFTVVQDIFRTETTELADVVLPAATWGEKTGCFTNADRTVHLSDKAVEPPGAALPDLDIFLDYAHRMGLRDKDGGPLITWSDAEGGFSGFRER